MSCRGLAAAAVIVLLAGVLAEFGCVSTDTGGAASNLKVVDWNWKLGEYGTRYIVGTVKNASSKEYVYVQIEFNLYDDSGAQVGSAFANVNNLEPYGTWKFEAIVLEDNATKARLKRVTGF